MPPLPPAANVFMVQLEGLVSATQPYKWANVLHLSWNGTSPTAAVATAFANATMSLWATHVSPLQSSQVSIDSVTYTDLTSNTGAVGLWESHTPGTRGDEFLAGNVAVLISYPAPLRYRGGHPRTYLFAGQQPDLADTGHWLGTFTDLVTTNWKAFLAGVIALSNSGTALTGQVYVSYYSTELVPTPPHRRTVAAVYPIAPGSAFAQAEVASQRRRIGRRRA